MNLDNTSPRIGETRRLSIVAETVAEAQDLDLLRHCLAEIELPSVAEAVARAVAGIEQP